MTISLISSLPYSCEKSDVQRRIYKSKQSGVIERIINSPGELEVIIMH